MNVSKFIQTHIDLAQNKAINEVERLARKILKEHPNLKDFVMAMGSATFTLNKKDLYGKDIDLGLEERAYFKPLYTFIREWDHLLHLTGYPMWIKSHDGPVIHDW